MVTIHSKSLGRLVLQITAASLKLGTIYNVESDLTSTFYDCSVVFVARLILQGKDKNGVYYIRDFL